MKVMHKLFVVALLLSLTLSVGAVMAQDDVTFEQSDVQAVSIETENMGLSQEDDLAESNNENDDSELSTLGGGEITC